MSTDILPRQLEQSHQKPAVARPKFLQRISGALAFNSQSNSDSIAKERRDTALRARGLIPGKTSKSREPPEYTISDIPPYDPTAAKRRREDALRERGLLPPAKPSPSRSSTTSSDSSQSSSMKQRHEADLRSRGLSPPQMRRAFTGSQVDEWDASALVEEIKMESHDAPRQTAAERIKAEYNGRPQIANDLISPPPRSSTAQFARKHTTSTPVSPSDELKSFVYPMVVAPQPQAPYVPVRRATTKDLPPLNTEPMLHPGLHHRSMSTPLTPLSSATLHDPPRQPLDLKMHNQDSLASAVERITDLETKRMTMAAFM